LKIGEPALPALEKAMESRDPEIRLRAVAILEKIQRGLPLRPGSTDEAVAGGLRWLADHQNPDGMWSCRKFMCNCKRGTCTGVGSSDEYDMGVTGLALLAFVWAGHTHIQGDFKDNVKNALKAMKDRQTPDGCFGKKSADGHWIYNHAIASLAMAEAYKASEKAPLLQGTAQKGVDFLIDCQNPFLGWRYGRRTGANDTSVTGWAVFALSAAKSHGLKVPDASLNGAMNWLNKVTDEVYYKTGYTSKGDTGARLASAMGKFQPSEAMTALGVTVRMLILGEEGSKTPEVLGGCNLLKQDPPRWSVKAGTIDMYYWFWGTQACYRVGRSYRAGWERAVRKALIPNQNRVGCEKGSWDPAGAWGEAGGRVYSTALNTLTLLVPKRYGK